jgi:divalent metal cation (Fe/Co/Zn/Cd) transporter
VSMTATPRSGLARRALRLGWFTIAYNVAEAGVAIIAGVVAGSVALTGFGLDSTIEVLAAGVVVHRLGIEVRGGAPNPPGERRALRFIAVTFFALAIYVTVEGLLNLVSGAEPAASPAGIAITAASAIVMPALARAKRRTGLAMGSALVVADAAETRLCALLSVSTLTGLILYPLTGLTWIDPIAGFTIAVFAIAEGREAWAGELVCGDDDHGIAASSPPRN